MISSLANFPNGITTDGDGAVVAIAAGFPMYEVFIVNEGNTPGSYSIDGGLNWCRLSATDAVTIGPFPSPILGSGAIMVKRVSGGSDLSGVYVSAVN